MNTGRLILWSLVALGLALIVQALGPYVIGAALAFGLYRLLPGGKI